VLAAVFAMTSETNVFREVRDGLIEPFANSQKWTERSVHILSTSQAVEGKTSRICESAGSPSTYKNSASPSPARIALKVCGDSVTRCVV
jgi:hypothetical protein